MIQQFKKDTKFALVVFGLRLEHRITVKLLNYAGDWLDQTPSYVEITMHTV